MIRAKKKKKNTKNQKLLSMCCNLQSTIDKEETDSTCWHVLSQKLMTILSKKKKFHMTLILEVFELAYKKLSQSFEL